MTGPGPGKIRLDARVVLVEAGEYRVIGDAVVYLHVKGWSRAFVTHVDIEAPGVEALVGGVKRGTGAWVKGVTCGFVVEPLRLYWRLEVRGRDALLCRFLSPGEGCRGFVGGKKGGVFIGFESRCLRRLEALAEELYGVKPRRGRR